MKSPWLILILLIGLAPLDTAAVEPVALPFVRIDPQRQFIELDAAVVLRESDWVELIACSPGSKEHESILTVAARPSHVHLALLILGLEPGAPMRFDPDAAADDPNGVIAPEGPAVRVTVVLPQAPAGPQATDEAHGKGQAVREMPVTDWVVDRATGQPLPDVPFRFTGSRMVPINERERYLADLNGTVISLVNFGDEVLARPTDLTNANDQASLQANTDAIPPLDTPVVLRLYRVEAPNTPAATPPGTGILSQPTTQSATQPVTPSSPSPIP